MYGPKKDPAGSAAATGTTKQRSKAKAGDVAAFVTATKRVAKKRRKKATIVINMEHCKYEVVEDCALERGWRVTGDEDAIPWNVYWIDTSVSAERCMAMLNYQKINHFPGMSALSRKNGLARGLAKMRAVFPEEYGFAPQAWTLPDQWHDFKAQFTPGKKGNKTFIVKPDHGCQGKGIFLTRRAEDVDPSEPQVAQRYIHKPLLIDGLKFDLRVYVLVTCCNPLRIFIFKDGLTRLCTEKYQPPTQRNLKRLCMHLTNYAINKVSDKFEFNEGDDDEAVGMGHKRTLLWFKRWLGEQGHDVDEVWGRMEDMIVKTLIPVQPGLSHMYKSCLPADNDGFSCFEILGLDVLFDHKLRPWLIEVNHSPSFSCDTPLDLKIKEELIADTMELIGVSASDRRKYRAQQAAQAQSRLYSGVFEATRRREDDDSRATFMAKKTRWENKHMGGYKRIYPCENEERMSTYSQLLAYAQEVFEETAMSQSRRAVPRRVASAVADVLSTKNKRAASAAGGAGGPSRATSSAKGKRRGRKARTEHAGESGGESGDDDGPVARRARLAEAEAAGAKGEAARASPRRVLTESPTLGTEVWSAVESASRPSSAQAASSSLPPTVGVGSEEAVGASSRSSAAARTPKAISRPASLPGTSTTVLHKPTTPSPSGSGSFRQLASPGRHRVHHGVRRVQSDAGARDDTALPATVVPSPQRPSSGGLAGRFSPEASRSALPDSSGTQSPERTAVDAVLAASAPMTISSPPSGVTSRRTPVPVVKGGGRADISDSTDEETPLPAGRRTREAGDSGKADEGKTGSAPDVAPPEQDSAAWALKQGRPSRFHRANHHAVPGKGDAVRATAADKGEESAKTQRASARPRGFPASAMRPVEGKPARRDRRPGSGSRAHSAPKRPGGVSAPSSGVKFLVEGATPVSLGVQGRAASRPTGDSPRVAKGIGRSTPIVVGPQAGNAESVSLYAPSKAIDDLYGVSSDSLPVGQGTGSDAAASSARRPPRGARGGRETEAASPPQPSPAPAPAPPPTGRTPGTATFGDQIPAAEAMQAQYERYLSYLRSVKSPVAQSHADALERQLKASADVTRKLAASNARHKQGSGMPSTHAALAGVGSAKGDRGSSSVRGSAAWRSAPRLDGAGSRVVVGSSRR